MVDKRISDIQKNIIDNKRHIVRVFGVDLPDSKEIAQIIHKGEERLHSLNYSFLDH